MLRNDRWIFLPVAHEASFDRHRLRVCVFRGGRRDRPVGVTYRRALDAVYLDWRRETDHEKRCGVSTLCSLLSR